MTNRVATGAAIAAISLSLLATAVQAETVTRSFDVQPGGRLEIDTDSGSIDVVTVDGTTLTIEVDMRGRDAAEFELEFSHDNSGVRVRGRRNSKLFNHRHSDISARFRASVPKRPSGDD